MQVQEGIWDLGTWCLVCQDPVCCYFTLFYCRLDLSCGECNVISLYFLCCSVNGSVCHLCCVLDSVCEFFGETNRYNLGVVVILLLNVMEVLSVGGGALLDRPCMVFQRMCVLCMWSQCVSRCSFHRFCLCFFIYFGSHRLI